MYRNVQEILVYNKVFCCYLQEPLSQITTHYDIPIKQEEDEEYFSIEKDPTFVILQTTSLAEMETTNQMTENISSPVENNDETVFPATKTKRSPIKMRIPEPPKKIFKRRTKPQPLSSFQQAVSHLGEIAKKTMEIEDEYDRFAKHIAAQLRQLPLRSFVILQEKIQSLVTNERLASMLPPSLSPHSCSSDTPQSHFEQVNANFDPNSIKIEYNDEL